MVRLFLMLSCGLLWAEHLHSCCPDEGESSSVRRRSLGNRNPRAALLPQRSSHGVGDLRPASGAVRRGERAGSPASVRGIITLDGILEASGQYGIRRGTVLPPI